MFRGFWDFGFRVFLGSLGRLFPEDHGTVGTLKNPTGEPLVLGAGSISQSRYYCYYYYFCFIFIFNIIIMMIILLLIIIITIMMSL